MPHKRPNKKLNYQLKKKFLKKSNLDIQILSMKHMNPKKSNPNQQPR